MKKSYCFLLANFFALSLFATHNKSGEIQYRQIGEKTIQCSIITHTDPTSVPSDRDSLLLDWGDGTSQWIARTNGSGELVNQGNQQNIYTAEHTYNDFGKYTLVMEDNNRNGGIINVPNSDQIPLHLYNTFILLSGSFDNPNSSPRTLFPPVDRASVFTPFVHLATAYDEDGDSLSYRLITPKGTDGGDIPLYVPVDQISPSLNNEITIDPLTGHIRWDSPQLIGAFTIAVEITSFRNGVQNGSFVRDMTIEVFDAPNLSPVIEQSMLPPFGSIQEVSIGDIIELSIPALDAYDVMLLESGGGLFEQAIQPSTFSVFSTTSVTGTFSWTVDESHLRNQPYDTAFKIANEQELAGFYMIRFKVIGQNTSAPVLAEDDHDIVVFPNPSSDFLAIKNDTKDLSNYEIFSVSGELIKHGELTSDRLDIRSLSSGSYILVVDGKFSVKFSKVGSKF